MTTILTLTSMFGGVRHNVPKVCTALTFAFPLLHRDWQVSYVSYLDIWMVMSLTFVNIFMFEFVFISFLIHTSREKLAARVEHWCRVLFAAVFLVFNLCYWPAVSRM